MAKTIEFKDEKAFKKWLVDKLEDMGYFVTPIQTRTVPGVPDLFVVGGPYDILLWIECKIIKQDFCAVCDIPYVQFKVPFRPGQQSRAYNYHKATGRRRTVICLVAFKNGVYGFEQTKCWNDKLVPASEFKKLILNDNGTIIMEAVE